MGLNSAGGRAGRGRRRPSRRAPMNEINVTPFVDVMLVLLIIFMVTAPLLNTGVAVELPESRASALDQKENPLEISIDREGAIFVDGDEVPFSQLPQRLEAIAAERDLSNPAQIMLRGDREIQYGQMMRVMGELNRAGLNSVNMVTSPLGSSTIQDEDR